jgi:hypothetical protein
MRRDTTSALGAFIVSSVFASLLSAQNAEIRWTRSFKFSASDKRNVIALAKLMGVQDPESVDANLRDDCCRIVAVKGRVVENGPERRWPQALMIRNSWREYAREATLQDRLREGPWIADGPPQIFAEWRVRDGAWFVDVGRGVDRQSMPYRDAELIVLALHRGTIVNKIAGQPSIPTLKGGMSYVLRKEPSHADASVSEYEVWIGSGRDGKLLIVRIVGDAVEAVAFALFEI